MPKRLIFGVLFCCFCQFAELQAQTTSSNQDSTKIKRSSFFALPVVYLTPETSWAFGGAGIYAFRLPGEADDSRASQIQPAVVYTLMRQLLLFCSFQLWAKEEKWNVYGELGYYRYNYFYYGVGNDQRPDPEENYRVNYPRFRLNVLKEIKPQTYLGLRYWMDNYDIVGREVTGELIENVVTGSQGGFLSGIGTVLKIDKRDNLFSATEGYYLESVAFVNGKFLGSDFNFTKFLADYAIYFENKNKGVWAFNAYVELTGGNAPFNELAQMGGGKKMRGFYQGRYRDNHYFMVQGEYRFPIFWRIGAVVFAGVGEVTDSFSSFNTGDLRSTYGAGLRFIINKNERINVRVDYGFAKNSSGLYLTIGEAF